MVPMLYPHIDKATANGPILLGRYLKYSSPGRLVAERPKYVVDGGSALAVLHVT